MKITHFVFICLFLSLLSHSQDSLYLKYRTSYLKANSYVLNDAKKAIEEYSKSYNYLESSLRDSNTNGVLQQHLLEQSAIKENRATYERAALIIADSTNQSSKELSQAFTTLVQLITLIDEGETRLNWMTAAISHATKVKDTSSIIRYSIYLGDLYNKNLTFINAEKYFAKAQELLELSNSGQQDLELLWNQRYASFQNTIEEFSNSTVFSLKELNLLGNNGDLDKKATSYNELSLSYNGLDDYEVSVLYADKAIEAWSTVGDDYNLAIAYLNRYNSLIDLDKTELAIASLEESLKRALDLDIYWVSLAATRKLAWRYYLSNNYKKAYEFERIGKILTKFEDKLSKSKEVLRLEAEFEMAENQKQIQAQKNLIAQAEIEKEQQKRDWLIVEFVALIIVIILVFIFISSRRTKKNNRELNLQKALVEKQNIQLNQSLEEKAMLVKEVHHRVKNNLTTLLGMFYLQESREEDQEVKKVLREAQNRVHSMALVHQKLYQSDNVTVVHFREYCQELISSVIASNGPKDYHIRSEIKGQEIELSLDKAIPMALIISELITNSLKYAFNETKQGVIGVDISQDGDTLTVEYYDSGKGIHDFEKFKASKSLGNKLIQVLASQIHATMRYSMGKYSSFFFTFKAE